MIPGHGQPITPHPNFQLFLTERVMEGAIANTKVSSLYTKCHFVRLNDDFDSIQRMEEVINVHFPKVEFQISVSISLSDWLIRAKASDWFRFIKF